jgi:hypothetical protein
VNKLFEPEKDIPRIFNDLYRRGVTKQDAIAFIAFILNGVYNLSPNKIFNEAILNNFEYSNSEIIKTFRLELAGLNTITKKSFPDKKVFCNPLRKIIIEWSEETTPDKKITPENVVKIMQSFAKNLIKNIEDPEFIDLSVGTGSILENLPGDIFGFDVDGRLASIAQNYLFFSNDFAPKIKKSDSISEEVFIFNEFQTSGNSSVFLFDPPMGDSRAIPANWSGSNYQEIIGNKTKKAASEALFLTNYLLHGPKDSFFIGLFPSSILFRSNHDYSTLRNYLMQNSLMFVIEVSDIRSSGKIILVGKKTQKNLNDFVPIITITDSNQDNSEFIANLVNIKVKDIKGLRIENDQFIYNDFAVIDFINRDEFIKNSLINNSITTPKKLPRSEILDSPDNLIKNIENFEKELSIEISELRQIIKIKDTETEKPIETKNELDIWLDEKENNHFGEIIAKFKLNGYISKSESELIYKVDFNGQKKVSHIEFLEDLKILFSSKMLSQSENNAFILDLNKFQAKINRPNLKENFTKFFNPENFDENIKLALKLLPNNQQDVYKKIYSIWLNREEQYNFNNSRDDLAILILKELYLIQIVDKEDQNDFGIEVKNEFIRPFHPVLDGGSNGI